MTAQPVESAAEARLASLLLLPRPNLTVVPLPQRPVVVEFGGPVRGSSTAHDSTPPHPAIEPGESSPAASEPGVPGSALDRMGDLALERSRVEAKMLALTLEISREVGECLLRDKGYSSIEELSAGARRRWRAETKRLTCEELRIKLGIGITESRQLVGVACAPTGVRAAIDHALTHGLVTWGHVRGFWDRAGALPAADARTLAISLFGDDPAHAVAERLAPDGTLLDRPWHHADYWAALEREVTRIKGTDVTAERRRRRQARADRHVRLRVDDDSTAALTVTGPATTLVAVSQRLDGAARALRKSGDERTLAQLRTDIAQTLLLHGTPDLTTGQDELLTPEEGQRIAQVVTARPAVHLQVIVPWDTLTGQPSCASCAAARPDEVGGHHQEAVRGQSPDTAVRGLPPDTDAPPETVPGGVRAPGHGSVAKVLGRHPLFLAPGHARELALSPGTTLSRLLVDPADGRLVERTITTYRPDAAMRRQVIAADVMSRSPGSRAPADACEIDHEEPWGPGTGATTEANLDLKDIARHQLKTKRWWTSALGPNRDVTWETLLGQTETTRCHDYRQYLRQAAAEETAEAAAAEHADAEAGPVPPDRDPDAELDLACRAIYAALAHRDPGAALLDDDDSHGATDHDPRLHGWVTLAHRGTDGQRRHGPPQDQASVARLLGFPTPEHHPPTNTPPQNPAQNPSDDPPPF